MKVRMHDSYDDELLIGRRFTRRASLRWNACHSRSGVAFRGTPPDLHVASSSL